MIFISCMCDLRKRVRFLPYTSNDLLMLVGGGCVGGGGGGGGGRSVTHFVPHWRIHQHLHKFEVLIFI